MPKPSRPRPPQTAKRVASPLPDIAVTKHRLDAISDGIYAIALTLLVLDLSLASVPIVGEAALREALVATLPNAATWLLSFWVVALFWIAHQRLYHLVDRLNARLVFIELFHLSLITLFPFTSALMGSFGSTTTAAAIYAGHLLVISLVLALRTKTFLKHRELHIATVSATQERALTLRATVLVTCSAATFALAFVVPPLNTLAMVPTAFLFHTGRAWRPSANGTL